LGAEVVEVMSNVKSPTRRGQISVLVLAALLLAALRVGCGAEKPEVSTSEVDVPGVLIRRVQAGPATVRLIDADLNAPNVRVEVVADEIAVRGGAITGRARTVSEWLVERGAIAGINGGFFGKTIETGYKEIVGLLKLDGRVRVAAPTYRARPSGRRYCRSALGLLRTGSPRFAWVTSQSGAPQLLRSHPEPELQGDGEPWDVHQALACGPRLIRDGKTEISFRGERLASPGALPRTFVGTAVTPEGVRRMVLCAADGMEFEDCAHFLSEYFRRQYKVDCADAMCLDGGASTQAAWRASAADSQISTDLYGSTAVPTALLVFADKVPQR
jgi:hypothetical protein